MTQNIGEGISAIICAYSLDRWKDIEEVIESLQRQTQQPREVILVIDHNPELLKMATEKFTGVLVTHNRGTKGASGARNSGVQLASSSIVAFLDDDVIVEPDWVETSMKVYREDENLIGVVGYVELLWLTEKPRWFPAEFNWVVGGSYRGMPEEPTPVRNGWAGNLSLRRELFLKIGGFREGFGKTGSVSSPEDTELCIRAGLAEPDRKWMFRPDVVVAHKVPAGRATWKYFIYRCYREGVGKAQLATLVGRHTGTKDERSYVRQVLPKSIWRSILSVLRGDFHELLHIGAILAGLSVTTLGYLIGWLQIISASTLPSSTEEEQ